VPETTCRKIFTSICEVCSEQCANGDESCKKILKTANGIIPVEKTIHNCRSWRTVAKVWSFPNE